MLGLSGAQVLNFHIDVRTAPSCPSRYQGELAAFFGPGYAMVIEAVRDALCKESGKTPNPACNGIKGCLDCIRGSIATCDLTSTPVQLSTRRGV